MRHLFLSVVLLLSTSYGAWAANSYTVAAGATVTINEHGTCKKVKNTGTVSRMVPTKSAAEWTSFQNNPNGMTLSSCACAFSTWTAIGPTNLNWKEIVASEDGSVMAAVQFNPTASIDHAAAGRLYVSTNGGSTWTARGPTMVTITDIDMSSDGSTIVMATYPHMNPSNPSLYVSTNSGATFTQRTNVDASYGVAVSGNSAMIGVTEYNVGVKTSANDGSTWTTRRAESALWDMALSDNGSRMAVAQYGQDRRILVSTNTGSTWTARGPAATWWFTDISADGSVIAAAGSTGYALAGDSGVYVSTDGGVTFTKSLVSVVLTLFGSTYGKPQISMDGETLIVNAGTAQPDNSITSSVRISVNGGTSWLNRHPTGDGKFIGGVGISGDGSIALATVAGGLEADYFTTIPGRIYKSTCN